MDRPSVVSGSQSAEREHKQAEIRTLSDDETLDAALDDRHSVPDDPWQQPRAPVQVGRYLVLEEIGRGSMGAVYTAYDPKLDRKIAIKLLRRRAQPGSPRTVAGQARLVREAQALAKLNHPNIVTVHDVDVHEGRLYMAMEYVEGVTLEQWLEPGKGWAEIVAIFEQAGQGLAAAHAAKITHRDFKPSNVLISTDGRVKVVDFGLAKQRIDQSFEDDDDDDSEPSAHPQDDVRSQPPDELIDTLHQGPPSGEVSAERPVDNSDIMRVVGSSAVLKLTQAGGIVGTPAYMAPEQYAGGAEQQIGAWTDQFSFGVALYEALYGGLPFAGENLFEVYRSIEANELREPPRDCQVLGWLFKVLRTALQPDPAERYASMEPLLARLRDDPARRRRRAALYAGAAGVLAVTAFGLAQATSTEVPAPCRGARDRLADTWDQDRRQSVEEALVATGVPFAADTAQRVSTGLDRYSEAWVERHTEICEATHIHREQSEALLDVRMTCLERRRGELGALVEVLAEARAETVERAVAAVTELRSPDPCATAQPGIENALPEDPQRRAEFLSLRARVNEARALLAAGRYAEASATAEAIAQEASREDHRPLLAEVLVIEGVARRKQGEPRRAQVCLRSAIEVAAEVADARTEVGAWTELLYVTGVSLGEKDVAAAWQFAAEVALRSAQSPEDLGFKLRLNIGAVLLEQRRIEEATRYGEEALALALEAHGRGTIAHARALNNLGIVAAEHGDWSLAERRLRESYDVKLQVFGAEHPEVARHGMNLASVLVRYGTEHDDEQARDEAARLYQQVADFNERTYGPRSTKLARALEGLGRLHRSRNDLAQARKVYQRAIEILRGQPELTGDLAKALNNLGQIERLEHEYALAQEHHREALSLQIERHGEQHSSVGRSRLLLCEALRKAKQFAEAVAECERAVAVIEATVPPGNPMLEVAYRGASHAFEAAGDPEGAARYRGRLAEFEEPAQGPSTPD